jgi:carboxymethylenebutenolidase
MCFDEDSHPPMPLSDNSTATGKDITLTASDGTRFAGYLADPGTPASAQVVILPDVRGLHNFYKELALRFADVGLRALAIDYFGRTAPSHDRGGDFDVMANVQQMSPESFGQDLRAAVAFVREGEGRDLPTFTVGFCMGGSLSFWSGAQGLHLAGVIGFYASLTRSFGAVRPAEEYASHIASPLLGLFGGADEGIPKDQIDAFQEDLVAHGIEQEIVVYPGAPHSFFDRKAEEYAAASADAWTRVQGFIADHGLVRA